MGLLCIIVKVSSSILQHFHHKLQQLLIRQYRSELTINQMFCILPCAVLKDKISLSPVGPAASIIPQMDKIRGELRKLSDTDYLIKILQDGEIIMGRKVMFDNYLSSQVDLMKSFVATYTPCNFIYASYFTSGEINTTGLNAKDQWAVEIVISRLNISSIYQAGSLNHMRVIFMQTANSYNQGSKISPDLIKNLKVTYDYFNEGYQPLKRMMPYFDAIESLASQPAKTKYVELNRKMSEIYTNLVTCNLAYIKIEKLRLLNQFKSCKEGAYAVYLKIEDSKLKLSQIKGSYSNISIEIEGFFSFAELFYQILAFYFMLVENEETKHREQVGFIKKQFQQMIYDNLVAIDEIDRLMGRTAALKSENDNVMFGMGVLGVIGVQVNKFKYRYSINVHENKMERPSVQEVVARRMGSSNIWNTLDFF